MGARTFEDLEVWQKAHQWLLGVYRLTACFPQYELFGLTSQLRRAAVSVPGNIAEGFPRRSRQEKTRFYNIAQGSLSEAHYYLILGRDLGYADTSGLIGDLREVGRMLEAYARLVAAGSSPPGRPSDF